MLCAGSLKPRRDTRKRSVVWRFFKTVDSDSDSVQVQCLLCSGYQSRQGQGTTTAMLRHLRVKHPRAAAMTRTGGGRGPGVDVEAGDSDAPTTVEEADINSPVNGGVEASRGGSAERTTRGDAGDGRPVKHAHHKRSLIWRYYDRVDGLDAARCRLCTKKLQCCEGGGTSNLRRHMSNRHPEVFSSLVAEGHRPQRSNTALRSNCNADTATPPQTFGATEQRLFSVSGSSDRERRVLRRERELIEALRRAQKEEARALEHQRELMEKLRAADAREAAAEREKTESLRKAQQEEAKDLNRQREELRNEKAELQKKWEELQQEREELLLFHRGQ